MPVPFSEPAPEKRAAPVPEHRPAPAPAPAPVAPAGDSGVWDAMVKGLNGKMDMGMYAILAASTQVSGTYAGGTLTVSFATPLAKMMLDKPDVHALFRQELLAVTGQEGQVVFADAPAGGAPKPDMGKLDALSRFGNIKFE